MGEVHFLARIVQSSEGEEHESDTKDEVAYVAVLLSIDEEQANEECRPDEVGDVERESRRHNPCRQCRSDVGTHDDRYSLHKREESGVDERDGHHRGCRRRLHRYRGEHSGEHAGYSVCRHLAQDMAQLRTRHLLEGLTHDFHTVDEQSQRTYNDYKVNSHKIIFSFVMFLLGIFTKILLLLFWGEKELLYLCAYVFTPP